MAERECDCTAAYVEGVEHSYHCYISQKRRKELLDSVEDEHSVFSTNAAGDIEFKGTGSEDETYYTEYELHMAQEVEMSGIGTNPKEDAILAHYRSHSSDDAPTVDKDPALLEQERKAKTKAFMQGLPDTVPAEWRADQWALVDEALEILDPVDKAFWDEYLTTLVGTGGKVGDTIPAADEKQAVDVAQVVNRDPNDPLTAENELAPVCAGHCKPAKHSGQHHPTCQIRLKATQAENCNCASWRYKGVHMYDCPASPDHKAFGVVETDESKCTCNAKKFNSSVHVGACPLNKGLGATGTNYKPTYVYKPSCKHGREAAPFKLTDTLSILLLADRDCKFYDDEKVDIGVYLYSGWQGKSVVVTPGLKGLPFKTTDRLTEAVMLPWPDYQPYPNVQQLHDVIQWMLATIAKGKVMETGCMGGHGRTGTMASCLLMAANPGMLPADALMKVRKEHCTKAVESVKQMDQLCEFYELVNGNQDWRKDKNQRRRWNKLGGSKSGGNKTGFQSSTTVKGNPASGTQSYGTYVNGKWVPAAAVTKAAETSTTESVVKGGDVK